MKSNSIGSGSSNNTEAASFENVTDQIWRTIVSTDIDPSLSHVEVMFGSGEEPWNGAAQRRVTYYLTSQRVNQLVLLSFNPCEQLCSVQFPHCFRIENEPDSLVASNKEQPASTARDNNNMRQCGRAFAKSKKVLRQALLLARHAHVNSAAKERNQWATLVQFDTRGGHRVLFTWPKLNEYWPNDSTVTLMLANSHYSVCRSGLILLAQIVAGFAILALVLALITVISDAVRKRKRFGEPEKRDEKPGFRQERRQAREMQMGQTLFYDEA